MKAINLISNPDRPREKLAHLGAEVLLDEELLAILLGSGSKGIGVHQLAKRVLKAINSRNGTLRLEDLTAIPGMGPAKAAIILSALEFARRRIRPRGVKIREAADILPLLMHWSDRTQEYFISITLNGAHEVIEKRVVTVGLLNTTQVHPREVFADAISDRACAIIVAHNHPSGDLKPSEADRKVTRTLQDAGKLLGITLLDHVIFAGEGYFSFQESGGL